MVSSKGILSSRNREVLNTLRTVHQKYTSVNRHYCTRENDIWRRGWDSNPRYGFPYARFRGEYFQPLSHLSADGEARLADDSGTQQRRCWRWLLCKIKRAKRTKLSGAQ